MSQVGGPRTDGRAAGWILALVWVGFGVYLFVEKFPTYVIGTDLRVYQRAATALYHQGNPYLANVGVFWEHHYRYPPLLAMVLPAIRWAWYPILGLATAYPLLIRWRAHGPDGLLLPALLVAYWWGMLLAGNAQGIVVALLCLVPLHRRTGAVAAAAATWVKVFPAVAVLWWIGRRDWRALAWFGVAFVVLGLVQLPWLGDFVRSTNADRGLPHQLSLLSVGPVAWGAAVVILAVLTLTYARRQAGWSLAVVLMLVSLPQLILDYLPVLLAAPAFLSIGLIRPREPDPTAAVRS